MKYIRTEHAVFVSQENETAVLNTESQRYFALDELGSFIWNLIDHPVSVSEITAEVMKVYDVEEKTCREDTAEFIAELAAAGLVTEAL